MPDLSSGAGFEGQKNLFVGRGEEMAKISFLLQKPQCRLLTVAGPGGVGKTCLILQLLSSLQLRNVFADGTYFVDLQPLGSEKFIAFAIAEVLNLNIQNPQELVAELTHYLRDKHLLLVLDNFEHLIAGTPLLLAILENAPDVKLLVTSREILNLKSEWVFQLSGLPFPNAANFKVTGESLDEVAFSQLSAYEAVQLFTNRACHNRPDFSLDNEQQSVIELCQLVEGLPLALEIAASNLKFLSCAALLAEYRRNLASMQTRLRDLPERHRSIRAVFDTSWQLLNSEEKAILGKLAIFRGGFTPAAASQITGCSLDQLLGVAEKSLLYAKDSQRFYLHELLRQYLWAYLTPEQVAGLHADFSAYYAEYVADQVRDISGLREREASRQIALELDNVRLTWNWLLQEQKSAEIIQMAYGLFVFYENQNRLAEAIELFESSCELLQKGANPDQTRLALAHLLAYLGWFYQTANTEKAVLCLQQSLALSQEVGTLARSKIPGPVPQMTLAGIYAYQGDYSKALSLARLVLQEAQEAQDFYNEGFALYVIARSTYAQGAYDAAKDYVKAGYLAYKKINSLASLIGCLNLLITISRAQGNLVEAREYARESLEIGRLCEDKHSLGATLALLAGLALEIDDYKQALELYNQSLTLIEEVGNKVNAGVILEGIGKAYSGLEQYEEAATYLLNSLKLSLATGSWSSAANVAGTFGELLVKVGQLELATALFGLVKQHPATLRRKLEKTDQLLLICEKGLPTELYLQAFENGKNQPLENVVTIIAQNKYLLAAPKFAPESIQPAPLKEAASGFSPTLATVSPPTLPEADLPEFIEPLTARESEILAMLDGGFTNQEIAEKLYLSLGTVKTHNYNIFSKLGVKNRVQAIKRAKLLNILS